MNEKIRALAEKSHLMGYMVHLYTVDAPAGYRVPLDNRKEAIEKFAELIVRECSKVVENGGYWSGGINGEKRQCTPSEMAQMINEHFGVKK